MKKIIVITALMSLAFVYIIAQTQKPTKNKIDTPAASIERGKAIYQRECLSCHQLDGGGVPHMNPPLAGSTDVLKDKKKIIGIVLNGMTDRVSLDDEYYSNNMASHSYLSNQQIADVLNYVRNSFGNKADIITAVEVKSVRMPKK